MKFQIGDYFKVPSNGNCGIIVTRDATLGRYKVIWAHSPKKNLCGYDVNIVDRLWIHATQAEFEARPVVNPTPPPRKTKETGDALDAVKYIWDPHTMQAVELHPSHPAYKQKKSLADFPGAFHISLRESKECDHKKEIPK